MTHPHQAAGNIPAKMVWIKNKKITAPTTRPNAGQYEMMFKKKKDLTLTQQAAVGILADAGLGGKI